MSTPIKFEMELADILKIKMFQAAITAKMEKNKNGSNLTFGHLTRFIPMDFIGRDRFFLDGSIKYLRKLINNKEYFSNFGIS